MTKPKDDVDKMFEEMFGYQPGDSAVATPEPEQAPTPPKPADTPEALDAAVQAVHAAVKAHTGRRPSVEKWRAVAAASLGVSRLYQKRWDAVLARGAEQGLLRVDNSLSYPVLEALEPPPPSEPEPEPEWEDTEDEPAPPEPKRWVASAPPENWNPPEFMDCGHFNLWLRTETNEAGEEVPFCEACRKKHPPSWRDLKGEFLRPIPDKLRRSEEKARMGGFPGYCCDVEGYYIGGLANDCRRENPKDKSKWCACHQSFGKLVGG